MRAVARWAVLPALALLALIVGGAFRLGGEAELAWRIWMVGLVATGALPVARTFLGALRGEFAADLVAALAIVTAVVVGEPFAGLVIVLMQTGGEGLEHYAAGRASIALRELEAAAPRIAHRIRDGAVEDIAAEAVQVGDLLLVRPGELIPTDGEVVQGRSHVDTSRLTGEPVPITATTGTRLLSGSANQESPLQVRATAVAGESQYARIVELVRSAQASKAPLQRIADRYAVWFTPLTLAVCAVAWLVSHDMARVLAVLVVATPCPLILATPIAIIGGINRSAARHIIIRNGGAMEQVAGATAVMFDKTGTLTLGRPEVSRVTAAPGWTEAEVLRLAAAVEHGSGHLLARSLVAAAVARPEVGAIPTAVDVVEAPGQGVYGRVGDREVRVGARSYLIAEGGCTEAELASLEQGSGGGIGLRAYVAADGKVIGIVEYADRVRDSAPALLRALHRMGIRRTVLLSGDHEVNARAVAKAVGIDEAFGDLLPEDKVAAVREAVAKGEFVVMVGDGVNDAPALSSANIGIAVAAPGGQGGGIATEAADIVLISDDIGRVAEVIAIARRTMRVAKQSLGTGLGLSCIAMVIAAAGYIPPAVGALLQEAIDVAVILNALRASGGGAGRAA